MTKKEIGTSEEKVSHIFEEKQERREFFKTLGKAALPAIAFLGLGTLGDKLYGSKTLNVQRSEPQVKCDDCKFDCTGSCEKRCGKKCEGKCSGTCEGDCSGKCKDEVKDECNGKSTTVCTSNTIS